MPKEYEIWIRKKIRQDVKEIIKMERMTKYIGDSTDSEATDEENYERKLEEKVQYGSDSDKDIDELVISKDTPFIDEVSYYEETDGMSYYEEEGEYELDEMEFVEDKSQFSASRRSEALSASRRSEAKQSSVSVMA